MSNSTLLILVISLTALVIFIVSFKAQDSKSSPPTAGIVLRRIFFLSVFFGAYYVMILYIVRQNRDGGS